MPGAQAGSLPSRAGGEVGRQAAVGRSKEPQTDRQTRVGRETPGDTVCTLRTGEDERESQAGSQEERQLCGDQRGGQWPVRSSSGVCVAGIGDQFSLARGRIPLSPAPPKFGARAAL